jgi:hypothetical protein
VLYVNKDFTDIYCSPSASSSLISSENINILSVSLTLSGQTVSQMWMEPVCNIIFCLPVSKRCKDAWQLAKYLLMSQLLEEHNLWRNKPEFGNPHATCRDDTLSHSHFCKTNKKLFNSGHPVVFSNMISGLLHQNTAQMYNS